MLLLSNPKPLFLISPSNHAKHGAPPSEAVLKASNENLKNWAQQLDGSTNREFKQVSFPSISPEGFSRVKIHDSVFHKGVELHKDFILGIFTGKKLFPLVTFKRS